MKMKPLGTRLNFLKIIEQLKARLHIPEIIDPQFPEVSIVPLVSDDPIVPTISTPPPLPLSKKNTPPWAAGLFTNIENVTTPILDLSRIPVLSFESSLLPLNSFIPNLDMYISSAKIWAIENMHKENCVNLSLDQAMALNVFTKKAVFSKINKKIRNSNQRDFQPFFPFLKLVLSALDLLPILTER